MKPKKNENSEELSIFRDSSFCSYDDQIGNIERKKMQLLVKEKRHCLHHIHYFSPYLLSQEDI